MIKRLSLIALLVSCASMNAAVHSALYTGLLFKSGDSMAATNYSESAAWTPSDFGGLSRRWVASDYNAATGTWKDRVGNICYGPYSTFGRPASTGGGVYFDGVDDGLRITNCTDAAASGSSIWMIYKQTANAPSWTAVFGGDSTCSTYNGFLIESNTKLCPYYGGYAASYDGGLNNLRTVVWSSDGKIYADGDEVGTKATPAAFSVEWIGRSSINSPYAGFIFECGVVSGSISASDAVKLHQYGEGSY